MPTWLAELLVGIAETSRQHGVDPLFFTFLYFASIPPYLASMAWLVRRLRRKQPARLALFATGFFFIMPSSYVALFGKNLPYWVYLFLLALVLFGLHSARKTLRQKVLADTPERGALPGEG